MGAKFSSENKNTSSLHIFKSLDTQITRLSIVNSEQIRNTGSGAMFFYRVNQNKFSFYWNIMKSIEIGMFSIANEFVMISSETNRSQRPNLSESKEQNGTKY